jgi:hypothetical protein
MDLIRTDYSLVEKSSKPAVFSTFYRRFRLSRASDNKQVGPTTQPPVKTDFH